MSIAKLVKITVCAALLGPTATVYATPTTDQYLIESISTRHTGRIVLVLHEVVPQCGQRVVTILPDVKAADRMLSTATAAHLAGRQVNVEVDSSCSLWEIRMQ